MKTLLSLLAVSFLSLAVQAADAPAKKKSTPKKAPVEATEKSPAKIEAIAKNLTPTQRTKLLDLLNSGSEADLVAIPGIGETRAAAIKKARPFKDVTNAAEVDGVGEGTFAEMVAYAKAGFPKADAAKSEAPKGDTKKKEEPKKKKSTTTKKK
ncbi:MAG: hypothetical protein IPK32_20980 [Verrucomicrobiaceae bacterium]|nr:hypothetical protein [Verrucomicrobiaceae bacterium]